ncbi:MAG: MBL fold metallo-hydrolase [Candidatus Methanomethylophilus sp.]|nr:MBL fold metallo-hydrolase [Methanomethylophilus sp.]
MIEVHVIASGSDGNCTVIQLDDEAVMIDAGLSYRQTHKLLDQEGVDEHQIKNLLITHEHSDHVAGAGPVSRKLGIPLLCNRATFNAFDLGNVDYREIKTMGSFCLGQMEVVPLPTSHNAVEPNAYLIRADGKSVLVATDTGVLTFPCVEALREADLAVIESNYDQEMLRDGPYPPALKKLIASDRGHMCNSATALAIKKTEHKDRQIFLAHLSKTNNTPDTARETVAQISGIKRMKFDCLEFPGDTRTLKV